ncbi:MAG: hypothetical protein JO368_05800 [Acidimicrobiales bacterium]|nr:hypothetical protein [Acidimicrobiales bacterium]
MAWQAVDRMHYSQAGGGGPQGVVRRAGSAAAGFAQLTVLGFGVGVPAPRGTPAQLAAVRHALALWQVNTVVISTNPGVPPREEGRDPTYAAGYMTAALGRLPRIEAGAWVWKDLRLGRAAPLRLPDGTLLSCAERAEGGTGRVVASLDVSRCVLGSARRHP